MKGYNGKILRVDLTGGSTIVESPPEDFYKRYLGGRGFIILTLLREVPKGVDPLGPLNKLVFALGPITGHLIPGSGRNSIGSKSPLTGGFGEAEAGGFWGAELKRAGLDAIIVEGVSPKPVYVWIENGVAEIRDAGRIWGMEIPDTQEAIREELGDRKIRTAIIGPSGEKLVRYACIMNDVSHAAGRTGLGAVMGSKGLKAVAVRGNNRPPEVADREKLVELSRWMGKHFKEIAPWWRYGTGGGMAHFEATGVLSVRNFTRSSFPGVGRSQHRRCLRKATWTEWRAVFHALCDARK